jgi:hypothetical protein
MPASAGRVEQAKGAFLSIPPEPLRIGVGWPRDPSVSALFNGANRRERYNGTRSRIFGIKSEDLGLSSQET